MKTVTKLGIDKSWRRHVLAATALVSLLLGGCAGTNGPHAAGQPPTTDQAAHAPKDHGDKTHDPLEGYNRFIFKVNDSIDRHAIEPVARGYRDYVPNGVRTGVHNFLQNLRAPINFANNLLQGDFSGAATDIGRFGLNTTIGVGGLFDVATPNGLKYDREDFGQTLGVWGVGPGPYFMLPILGPSTIRDTVGIVVDSVADPVDIYLYDEDLTWLAYVRAGADGLDKRTQLLDAVDDLRRNSIDFYAATRSAYLQERAAAIRDQKATGATGGHTAPAIPDYGDHP